MEQRALGGGDCTTNTAGPESVDFQLLQKRGRLKMANQGKRTPRRSTLQYSKCRQHSPASCWLLAAPSSFLFYRKEKERKGSEFWPGAKSGGCKESGNSCSP
jgi:hypothetical protein